MRVAIVRTGIVLDADSGALATMLTPFKLGVGGPVAGGRQYMPWIHREDEIGLLLAALDNPGFSGPINGSAPEPATNRDFSRALGRALHRPAFAPIPAAAIKVLYGDMAQIVVEGRSDGARSRRRAGLHVPPSRPRRGPGLDTGLASGE